MSSSSSRSRNDEEAKYTNQLLLNNDFQPYYDSIELPPKSRHWDFTDFIYRGYNCAKNPKVIKIVQMMQKFPILTNILCYILAALTFCSLTLVTVTIIYSTGNFDTVEKETKCEPTCKIQLVESIPDDLLPYVSGTNSTYNAWMEIISSARKSLHLAFFYSNLRNNAIPLAKGYQGNNIFDALVSAKKNRGVNIQIIQSKPTKELPDDDTQALADMGVAEVVSIDWVKAFGAGILHTKLLIADDETFYVGSANLDWTSLSQVKEVGIYVRDCPCLALDITKIFFTYHYLGVNLNSDLSNFHGWPQSLYSQFNEKRRLAVRDSGVFFSASPQLLGPGRTNDIDALLHVINNATRSVSISVMEYLPLMLYSSPRSYWGEIENAIRSAIVRNVTVRMLISDWNHTHPTQVTVLQSLELFGSNFCKHTLVIQGTETAWCTGSIHIKMMRYPDPKQYLPYPFTRVNHAKYIVSEKESYISTNNWTDDYFSNTGGISFVSDDKNILSKLQDIFDRDFNAQFSRDVQTY